MILEIYPRITHKSQHFHSLKLGMIFDPKGRVQKKKREKVWSFAKPPSDPPPVWSFFTRKKLTPIFFLEIRPLLGETNFTLGPISKSIIFCFYNGFYNCLLSPQDLGRSGYFQSCPNSCRYEIGTPDQV